MTSPFSADDMMKRSLFGSLIGFARKKTKPTETGECSRSRNSQTCFAGCSFRSPPSDAYTPEPEVAYLPCEEVAAVAPGFSGASVEGSVENCPSEQEIYREIVNECARFEEDKETSRIPAQLSELSALQESCVERLAAAKGSPAAPLLNSALSIEEFIKLVLAVVKESSLYTMKTQDDKSPEEILKKKRAQNNEAAARYRRRQRELREETEIEVRILENKNRQLKEQIQLMQHEIDSLKDAVLHPPS